MKEVLEIIAERISKYEFLNNLISGTIFALLMGEISSFKIQTGVLWNDLVLFYFIGMVIGRIGSLVIEPLMQKIGIIKRIKYESYVKAEKKDGKIQELSMINNFYRTLTSATISLLILYVLSISLKQEWFEQPFVLIMLLFWLTILFLFSYRKQTRYISKRADAINNGNIGTSGCIKRERNANSGAVVPHYKNR